MTGVTNKARDVRGPRRREEIASSRARTKRPGRAGANAQSVTGLHAAGGCPDPP
jgi:hypothetical protein